MIKLRRLKKNDWISLIIYIFIIGWTGIVLYQSYGQEFSYKQYETSTLTYNKAIVISIKEQDLEDLDDYQVGYQKLLVRFISGEEKGKKVEVQNSITATHNIVAKVGQTLVICSDIVDNAESYYTVYNYYRSASIWWIVGGFLLVIGVVGGKKGIKSGLSLLFTMFMIVCFILPAIYRGDSPVITVIISAAISTSVSLFMLNGLSVKTLMDILSTTTGVIIAGLLFYVISKILIISGYQADEAESLILIAQSTGLHIRHILFVCVLIASLGAVMDVAVSIGAALYEIARLNPDVTGKTLFFSGMNIGKDMIGTMTNTLILAFAGSSMMTLLVLISYGVQYEQLLSSDYIAMEIAQSISGSAAVVIMVPVASFYCALCYPRVKHWNMIRNGGEI